MNYLVITLDVDNRPTVETVEADSRAEAVGGFALNRDCRRIAHFLVTECPPSRLITDEYLFKNIMRGLKNQDRKISAIKFYRYLTGKGMKESKEFVEDYWENF